jgi:hypothetical protein
MYTNGVNDLFHDAQTLSPTETSQVRNPDCPSSLQAKNTKHQPLMHCTTHSGNINALKMKIVFPKEKKNYRLTIECALME